MEAHDRSAGEGSCPSFVANRAECGCHGEGNLSLCHYTARGMVCESASCPGEVTCMVGVRGWSIASYCYWTIGSECEGVCAAGVSVADEVSGVESWSCVDVAASVTGGSNGSYDEAWCNRLCGGLTLVWTSNGVYFPVDGWSYCYAVEMSGGATANVGETRNHVVGPLYFPLYPEGYGSLMTLRKLVSRSDYCGECTGFELSAMGPDIYRSR